MKFYLLLHSLCTLLWKYHLISVLLRVANQFIILQLLLLSEILIFYYYTLNILMKAYFFSFQSLQLLQFYFLYFFYTSSNKITLFYKCFILVYYCIDFTFLKINDNDNPLAFWSQPFDYHRSLVTQGVQDSLVTRLMSLLCSDFFHYPDTGLIY